MSLQKWSDRIWVVTLAGEPGFSDDLDALHHQAAGCVRTPHIVLDLAGVKHMNSANMSALLRVRRMVIDGDAQLKLSGPTDEVWALFLITGLDKVFDFVPNVSTALAGLKLSPGD